MRIVLVAQEYPPETAKGGIGSQTYLKAHGLAARGHEVIVVSRSPREHEGRRTQRSDGRVRLVRIPGFETRMGVYSEPADWLTYSGEVAAEIDALHREAPIDVVEFPEWAAEGYVHLVNRSAWNHIPAIVQLHGPLVMFGHAMGWPDLESELYRTGTVLEAACVRLADAVYSSSVCSADWVARHYGVPRTAIRVLHAGVDVQAFSPRDRPKAPRPTVVFAGKLVPNKGILELVAAVAALAREIPTVRLTLIGRCEPSMAERLSGIAVRAGAGDLLEFAGFVAREDLPEHLSRAHVFAMPSHYEPGPGLVYLEAMACGLPVIGCAGAGAAEVIQHGVTGFLVAPRDVGAVASALRAILGDDARREAMGRAARQYAVEQADARQCVAAIEAYYGEVVSRPRHREPLQYPCAELVSEELP
jgi:glycosyltransferase involved in cell wall biosynthesis